MRNESFDKTIKKNFDEIDQPPLNKIEPKLLIISADSQISSNLSPIKKDGSMQTTMKRSLRQNNFRKTESTNKRSGLLMIEEEKIHKFDLISTN